MKYTKEEVKHKDKQRYCIYVNPALSEWIEKLKEKR